MRRLKPREQSVYDYISESITENGYAPSVRDIEEALGFRSTSTVHMYINRLEEFGLIRKTDGKSRSITLTDAMLGGANKIPILGKVTAGAPILAEQNFDGYIDFFVETKKYDKKNLFALKVSGVSMIEAGIMDGDYVIVDRCDYAENGDIIVALVEDEATVKTFYKENGHFRLQPENSSLKPILVKEMSVLGKVVASVRFY